MKKHLILIIASFLSYQLLACTTFSFSDAEGHRVFGRNFDFPVGMGHIQVNYRNMHKTAFIRPPEKAMSWISKYGSISFNQCGREFPYGGMNEAGLVVEQMWLEESVYPEADVRYGLTELQWIQYQLDNSATVAEIIASDSLIRVSYTSVAPLHFLVSDAGGDVATIEYLEGKMVVHRGENLPCPALANSTYEHSLKYKQYMDSDQSRDQEWTGNTSGRFAKAASMIEAYSQDQDIVEYSFSILNSVSQGPGTQWSIVYDLTELMVYYKSTQNEAMQKIELADFDFSCSGVPLFVDLSETIIGAESFHELSYKDNYDLIESVINGVDFLKNTVPRAAIEASARYAESVNCQGD
jgi:choloylglycine hydrolase